MILQKAFYYADLLLKKHFLLSMLKTFIKNMLHFFQDSLIKKKFKRTTFVGNSYNPNSGNVGTF